MCLCKLHFKNDLECSLLPELCICLIGSHWCKSYLHLQLILGKEINIESIIMTD